ncbi:MAG: DNA-deoxyinosine glycosylase [Candidatus Omnitrophota bacterium]
MILKKHSKRIVGFAPIADKNSKVLILGSMPGVKALQVREYYGNPQNHFWKVMTALLGAKANLSYADKKKLLVKNKIALWDVVFSCQRAGSADSAMRNIRPNNFRNFFKKYANIKMICFNGQTAAKIFQRFNSDIDLPSIILPSTSPAHTIGFKRKLKGWGKILNGRSF